MCSPTFSWPSSNSCSDLLCTCLGLRCTAISKKRQKLLRLPESQGLEQEKNSKMKRVCNMTFVTLLSCALWPSCIPQRNYSLAGISQGYLWNTTIIFPEQNNTLWFASNGNTSVEKNLCQQMIFILKSKGEYPSLNQTKTKPICEWLQPYRLFDTNLCIEPSKCVTILKQLFLNTFLKKNKDLHLSF